MFCIKCGNELKDGEAYCPMCGTKVGCTGAIPISFGQIAGNVQEKAGQVLRTSTLDKIRENLSYIGDAKMLYFSSIVLLVISMILILNPMMEISGPLGIAKEFSMFEKMEGLKFLAFAGYIAAIAFAIYPALSRYKWDRKYFLTAKIVTGILLACFIVILFRAFQIIFQYLDYLDYLSIDFSLTFPGWVFLISSIANEIVLYFLCCRIDLLGYMEFN